MRAPSPLLAGCGAVVLGLGVSLTTGSGLAADSKVIELTQVPCQFLEAEHGKNHGFESQEKADCEAINSRTGATRLATAKTFKLEPGKYVFRVTNRNVPYELGFWLRGDGLLNRISLPSVSGGGLATGTTRDFEIILEEGEYVYSCPLNPTLNYRLIVQ